MGDTGHTGKGGGRGGGKAIKFDPNTEAFQMRAQWKKQDNCRAQWFERWSWLLDERKETLAQAEKIRQEVADITRSQATVKTDELKSLKPVPLTSTGVIGWLSQRPDCALEIYQSWLYKPPLHLPDAWDDPEYTVGVDEDMVRSLAKELVDDSLEMLVMAERARRADASGLPGLPTSSSASRPLTGAGGGFSSTGTMYDSIAA